MVTNSNKNEELNYKTDIIKNYIFLEMEIIKERINDDDRLRTNLYDLSHFEVVLNDLREIKEFLRPF